MTIVCRNLGKAFGDPPVEALRQVSLEIASGEFVAITGRSGSGKSTLLYILSTLDPPSSGELSIDGLAISGMNPKALHEFRNRTMGFIFQFHYLLPELTALENVLMPAMKPKQDRVRKAMAESLLGEVGLQDKLHRRPAQMSGGEQQRVAIARALIMEPKYLFADEPTGNLDSANGDTVMRILAEVNSRLKTTVIMVTHDPDYAGLARRQIQLVDGMVAFPEQVTR